MRGNLEKDVSGTRQGGEDVRMLWPSRVRVSDRSLVAVAFVLAAVSVLGCAAAVIVNRTALDGLDVPRIAWSDLVLGTVYPVAGAVLVRSRPRNAVGWVLVSAALIGPYLCAGSLGAWSELVRSEPLPATDALVWFAVWGFVPYFYVLPLALLLFPDGRPATPRWRPAIGGLLVVATIAAVTRMLAPVEPDMIPQLDNPLAVLGTPSRYVTQVGSLVVLFGGSL